MASRTPENEFPNLTCYVSLKELAEMLHMDRSTVRRNMKKAGISALELGGCVRYRKDEVDRYLGSLLMPPPPVRERA